LSGLQNKPLHVKALRKHTASTVVKKAPRALKPTGKTPSQKQHLKVLGDRSPSPDLVDCSRHNLHDTPPRQHLIEQQLGKGTVVINNIFINSLSIAIQSKGLGESDQGEGGSTPDSVSETDLGHRNFTQHKHN